MYLPEKPVHNTTDSASRPLRAVYHGNSFFLALSLCTAHRPLPIAARDALS